MRTSSMGILAASLLCMGGCGTEEDLDLSELPIADESKADQTSGTSEYLWTRPIASQVVCVRAPCESHIINDVNLDRIQLVYAFDLRALKLSSDTQGRLDGTFSKMLLYGRYGTAKVSGEPVRIFQITRANPRVSEASTDNADTDRYYSVHADDPSCKQPPCAAWTARLMNSNSAPSEQWSGIDLSRLQLGQEDQQKLSTDLQNGNAYLSTSTISVRPVPVSEAFRPLNALP